VISAAGRHRWKNRGAALKAERRARRRVGIFGGTFDPPHLGHLVAAQEAVARLDLDVALFVPTGIPPHKHDHAITPSMHRRAMVEAAIAGDAHFAISTVELERPGPSYTVDTLAALQGDSAKPLDLWLILGGDMVYDLGQWHDATGILRQVTGIVAVHRPGFGLEPARLARLEEALPGARALVHPVEAPQVDVSSTMVRERVAAGLPIRYLVTDAVAGYIAAHDLYRNPDHSPPEDDHATTATGRS
jgi:nicotinate-nucleotide adenylyltransferase